MSSSLMLLRFKAFYGVPWIKFKFLLNRDRQMLIRLRYLRSALIVSLSISIKLNIQSMKIVESSLARF